MPKRRTRKKKSSIRLNPAFVRLIESTQKLRAQAKALGIFTDDRELLECNKCGLLEDVTFEGMLVTYKRISKKHKDSGLRFQEVNPTHFRCPKCHSVVELKEEDFFDE